MIIKTTSSNEIKEIYNLEVVTAAFYKKSDFIPFDQYLSSLENNIGTVSYDPKTQNNVDNRSRLWTSIPLSDFVTPLINRRQFLKNQIKLKIDIESSKAEDSNIKLIINSLYGVLCSSYFIIGNSILANNITARARVGVWCVSRAVSGFQSITDGCTYPLRSLLKFKENCKKKPSLFTLSDLTLLETHRGIIKHPLIEDIDKIDWNESLNDFSFKKTLDEKINTHIQLFWKNYDFKIPYVLEHKFEHFGNRIIYIKSGNYGILPFLQPDRNSLSIIFKCRGIFYVDLKKNSLDDSRISVYQKLFNHLLLKDPFVIDTLSHKSTRIATIHDFFINEKKRLVDRSIEQIFPGDTVLETETFQFTVNERSSTSLAMYKNLIRNKKNFANLLLNNTKNFDEMFKSATKYFQTYKSKYTN